MVTDNVNGLINRWGFAKYGPSSSALASCNHVAILLQYSYVEWMTRTIIRRGLWRKLVIAFGKFSPRAVYRSVCRCRETSAKPKKGPARIRGSSSGTSLSDLAAMPYVSSIHDSLSFSLVMYGVPSFEVNGSTLQGYAAGANLLL
jgi:hypothetical protein